MKQVILMKIITIVFLLEYRVVIALKKFLHKKRLKKIPKIYLSSFLRYSGLIFVTLDTIFACNSSKMLDFSSLGILILYL